jgi:hypothetical protein
VSRDREQRCAIIAETSLKLKIANATHNHNHNIDSCVVYANVGSNGRIDVFYVMNGKRFRSQKKVLEWLTK